MLNNLKFDTTLSLLQHKVTQQSQIDRKKLVKQLEKQYTEQYLIISEASFEYGSQYCFEQLSRQTRQPQVENTMSQNDNLKEQSTFLTSFQLNTYYNLNQNETLNQLMKKAIIGLNKNGYLCFFDQISNQWVQDQQMKIVNQKIKFNDIDESIHANFLESTYVTTNNERYVIALQKRSDSQFVRQSSPSKLQKLEGSINEIHNSHGYKSNNFILKLSFESLEIYQIWLNEMLPLCFSDCQLSGYYEVLSKIGQGNFAQVYLAKVKQSSPYFGQHEFVAVKRIVKGSSKNTAAIDQMKLELEAMQDLRFNSNVTQLLQVFETEKSVHLVMEYIKDGTLYSYLKSQELNLNREIIEDIIGQLIKVVHDIHKSGYIHRDLKPLNVLINIKKVEILANNEYSQNLNQDQKSTKCHIIKKEYPQIKIADFGLADKMQKEKSQNEVICGTPGFMAPEILNNLPYDQSSDVFSLGCLIYFILTGSLLIKGSNFENVMKNNKDFYLCGYEYETSNDWRISKQDWKLLTQFLDSNPNLRCKLSEVIQQDSWFNGFRLRDSIVSQQIGSNKMTSKKPKNIEISLGKDTLKPIKSEDDNIQRFSEISKIRVEQQNKISNEKQNNLNNKNFSQNIQINQSNSPSKLKIIKDDTPQVFANLDQLLKNQLKNINNQQKNMQNENETFEFLKSPNERLKINVLDKSKSNSPLLEKIHKIQVKQIFPQVLDKQIKNKSSHKAYNKQIQESPDHSINRELNLNKIPNTLLNISEQKVENQIKQYFHCKKEIEEDNFCNLDEYECELDQLTDIIAFVPVLHNKERQMKDLNGPLIKQKRIFVQ